MESLELESPAKPATKKSGKTAKLRKAGGASPKLVASPKNWDDYSTAASQESENNLNLDATRLYLNEIGYSPLLTAGEEVLFA